MNILGKSALVTGSAVGVGRATAVRLAGKGASVVINYSRSEAEARAAVDLCRQAGGQAVAIQADVSQDSEARRLIEEAVKAFGGLDIVVNNAATTNFVAHSDLEGLTEAMWDRMFRTNVLGTFFCTRAAVPHMRRAGEGAVVNVTSMAGIQATGSSIAYCASKAAVINMTLSLARALAPDIRVNAVAPGPIDTRWLTEGLGQEGYLKLEEHIKQSTPLGRISTPEEVAETIAWLIEGAANTTGEVIKIDSGGHLGMVTVRPRSEDTHK
jgi:3-oxoacyl-[acyl-carrier protein] reductase